MLQSNPFYFRAEAADSTLKIKSPKGALIRANLIPGWGQFYTEKYWKALLVLGVESWFVGHAIYYNQELQKSRIQSDIDWYTRRRNDSNWALLVTRLLAMLDAYVDAHLYEFDESPDLSQRIQPYFAMHVRRQHISTQIAFVW